MTLILGIDPGSRITGYGVVKDAAGVIEYVDSGCIRTGDGPLSEKLLIIFNGICELMEMYSPNEVAVEQVFLHQNANVALKLGHARGVAMVAAATHRASVFEYSARMIKQSVVGYGAADKHQVSDMVMRLLKLLKRPQVDASDGLAIALCHAHIRKSPLLVASLSGRKK